jgi:hypothetical protein
MIAYRTAHQPFNPPPCEAKPREIYHSICPFPALSPVPDEQNDEAMQEQEENEAIYRQLLVQGVLAILLPTEDLENDCLTAIVGQIFSEMILGNGIGVKASEPWLLWEGITKIAEVVQARLQSKSNAQAGLEGSPAKNKHSQSLSTTENNTRLSRIGSAIQTNFWVVLQYVFVALTVARFIVVSLATSPTLPSRVTPTTNVTSSAYLDGGKELLGSTSPKTPPQNRQRSSKQPILVMKMWSCAAVLLDLSFRMPWLSATISMLQWVAVTGPGEVGNTDGMIDK